MSQPDPNRPQPPDDLPERDDLWELLGRPPRPKAPPFFVSRVMRQIEPRRAPRAFWTRWFRMPAAPLWAAAAALVLLFLGIRLPDPGSPSLGTPTPVAQVSAPGPDLELIADLDQLIAYEESATWLETPAF